MQQQRISSFLSELPEEVVITGDYERNQLYINGKKIGLSKSIKVMNHFSYITK